MKVKKIKINRGYLKFVSLNLSLGRRVICSENDKEIFDKIMGLKILDISEDESKNPQILIIEKEDCCDLNCKNLLCDENHECQGCEIHKAVTLEEPAKEEESEQDKELDLGQADPQETSEAEEASQDQDVEVQKKTKKGRKASQK
jgi:hypothetical protein